MLDFLRKGLGKVITVLFVLTVIGFGVLGFFLGEMLFDLGLIGLILGILVGIFISILTYGLIATFINIADNTEKINYQLSKISNKLDNLSAISTNNSTVISTNNSTTDSTNDSWVCKNCGETNYGNTICSKCGRLSQSLLT